MYDFPHNHQIKSNHIKSNQITLLSSNQITSHHYQTKSLSNQITLLLSSSSSHFLLSHIHARW